MHFTHLNHAQTGKAGKIALVAAFHVVLAFGLITSMNSKMLSMPRLPEDLVTVFVPDFTPPTPAPQPPTPMPTLAPPDVVVPKIEVDVPQPPPDVPQVRTTTESDQAPATPGPVAPQAPAAQPGAGSTNTNAGVMHSAVLADASGCARPEYPARAARNGESGTVTLALLVGTDGRVAGSRVQSTSGSRDLDRAAVAALSLCKFKPAMSGGVAQQAWAQLAYVWTLEQ